MEMVATSKMKRAQDRVAAARPYAEALREVIANLYTPELSEKFPLLRQPAQVKRAAVILVTGNRGLAGAFNACSTLFTMDFYKQFRPSASQAQLVWIGRVATVVMILIALLWIPVIQGARGLYEYLQGIQGYLAPPIAAVFFLGVFNQRLNAAGCLAALVVGFALGMFRLLVDTPVTLGLPGFEQGYPAGSLLWIVNNTYFQYYSLAIFVVSCAVLIGVSYLTPPPDTARIAGLTRGTLSAADRAENRRTWNQWDVLASAVVLVLILAAYLYFVG